MEVSVWQDDCLIKVVEPGQWHQNIIALINGLNGSGDTGLAPEEANGNPERLGACVTSHFRTGKTLWSASTSNTRKHTWNSMSTISKPSLV